MSLYDFLSTSYDGTMKVRIINNDKEWFYGTMDEACDSVSRMITDKRIEKWLVDDNYDFWVYL